MGDSTAVAVDYEVDVDSDKIDVSDEIDVVSDEIDVGLDTAGCGVAVEEIARLEAGGSWELSGASDLWAADDGGGPRGCREGHE